MSELTYREAARRVDRSVKTIKRWRRNGLPMGWDLVDGQRCRVVDERALLAWWRERLTNDPIHQQRMRALQHAGGMAPVGSSESTL